MRGSRRERSPIRRRRRSERRRGLELVRHEGLDSSGPCYGPRLRGHSDAGSPGLPAQTAAAAPPASDSAVHTRVTPKARRRRSRGGGFVGATSLGRRPPVRRGRAPFATAAAPAEPARGPRAPAVTRARDQATQTTLGAQSTRALRPRCSLVPRSPTAVAAAPPASGSADHARSTPGTRRTRRAPRALSDHPVDAQRRRTGRPLGLEDVRRGRLTPRPLAAAPAASLARAAQTQSPCGYLDKRNPLIRKGRGITVSKGWEPGIPHPRCARHRHRLVPNRWWGAWLPGARPRSRLRP